MTASELPPVDTPALLIDLDVVSRNLAWMQKKADLHGVTLRPHIKTHKIPELAKMQTHLGAIGVTVAKLAEAEVMAEGGIDDIFIANQMVTDEKLKRLVNLSSEVQISVGLDSMPGARKLSTIFSAAGLAIDYLLEIDTGLNRCGVLPGKDAVRLFEEVNTLPALKFKGIFTHAGQVYGAGSLAEVRDVSLVEGNLMVDTANGFKDLGVLPEIVSVGSTPTMKVWQGHEGINEIRPGNYIFNDAMQVSLGVAKPEECALTVVATVISRPAKQRAVLDAGSKVFSLDKGVHGKDMMPGFGMVLGRKAILERLSEEHGVLSVDCSDDLEVGDTVRIIPNHACTVVNLFDKAYGIKDGVVVEEFRIAARGKVQ
jgi:D-serine deaminase-like pyridoxal phosphate-dependent protein